MPATEQSGTNAAEIIASTSPAAFFSCVQQIESRVSAQTLEILRSRHWEGPLTDEDWRLAEELELDPVTVSFTSRNDKLLYRLAIPGYSRDEVFLHIQGNLLCICGSAPRVDQQAKMFYARIALPPLRPGYRCAAWISAPILHVSIMQDIVIAGVPIRSPQPMPKIAESRYAAAM